MIRTLSFNGSLPRYTTIRRLRTLAYRESLTSTSIYKARARQLSSSPNGPSGSTKSTKVSTSDLPPQPKAKAKVELRPGPVKTLPSTSKSNRPPPPPQAKLQATQPTVSASDLEAALSQRNIIDKATQHIILAPPPPNASWLGVKFHTIKEFAKFYWRGIKMILAHRKHVAEIRERVKSGGSPLTRWESRFIQTYSRDIVKLVPFVLTIAILEELIPLIIIFAPNALPSTCILPSQRAKIEAKKMERQRDASGVMKSVLDEMKTSGAERGWVSAYGQRSVAISGMLQLSTFGTNGMRMQRIHRHLTSIAADDALLRLEDCGGRLTVPELTEALQERGLITTHLPIPKQKSLLRWWLTTVDAHPDKGDPVSRRIFAVVENLSM